MNEMMMLRRMCGVAKKDNTRNENVRVTVILAPGIKRCTEKSLKWFDQVKRVEE